MADRSHSSELTRKFSPGPAFRCLSSQLQWISFIFFCEADAVYEVLENEAGKTCATLPESLLQNTGLIPSCDRKASPAFPEVLALLEVLTKEVQWPNAQQAKRQDSRVLSPAQISDCLKRRAQGTCGILKKISVERSDGILKYVQGKSEKQHFSRVSGYKINTQKSNILQYTNNKDVKKKLKTQDHL